MPDINDGLTDEERAALQEPDEADAQAEATPAEAKAEDAKAEEKPAEQPKAEEPAKAEAEAKAEEKPTTEAQPEAKAEEPKQEEAPKSAPILIATAVDTEATLKEIEAKKADLLEKFDSGELTAKEYQLQYDALAREERKAEFAQHEAALAKKLEAQRMQNEWASECNRFVDANPIYKNNQRLFRALDQEVRDLAQKPETANWTGQQFLREAHKTLSEAFGLATEAKPAKDKPALPPSIAKVPSAEIEDTSGGEFAVLDRMAANDPLAYEEALAKMPEAKRKAYLAAA